MVNVNKKAGAVENRKKLKAFVWCNRTTARNEYMVVRDEDSMDKEAITQVTEKPAL